MSGEATPAQIGGLLMAMRVRGETVAEITGAVRAMRARMTTIEAPAGALAVEVAVAVAKVHLVVLVVVLVVQVSSVGKQDLASVVVWPWRAMAEISGKMAQSANRDKWETPAPSSASKGATPLMF